MLKKFTFLAIAASLFIACGDDSSSSPNTEESLNNSDASSSSVSATGASDSSAVDTTSPSSSESSASETSGNSSSSLVAFSSSSTTATSSSSIVETSSSSITSAASSSSTEDSSWRTYCLDVINKYRATENLKPLTLAPEAKQSCADEQSAADLASGKAHGHFGDCGEFAQNSGPNIDLKWQNTEEKIIDTYLEMMWNEKKLVESGERNPDKKEDFSYIGHYLNMSSTKYTSVACGIAKNSDGTKGWLNINFH